MLENYVKKLTTTYSRMTPEQRRASYVEVAGGLGAAFLAKFFGVPDYVAILPLGYSAIKVAPVAAYLLQNKLTGPSSVIISPNEEVVKLIGSLKRNHQELEVFASGVYSEEDGRLVLADTKGVFGYVTGLIPGLRTIVGSDPLDTIESKFREYLTRITSDVVRLAEVTKTKKGEIEGLEQKLGEMNREKLGISGILDYMLQKVPEIKGEKRVMEFLTLDMEKSLTEEQRIQRRDNLVEMLYQKLKIMELGQDAMYQVAINAREIYLRALQQYDAFTSIKPQLQAARDATLTATDTSQLSVSARDYVIRLIQTIGKANQSLLEGLNIIDKTLIASPETNEALKKEIAAFYNKAKQLGLIGIPPKGLIESVTEERV